MLILLWLVTAASQVADDSQYCAVRYRRLCQGKGLHVACQFPDEGPGESCENYTAIDFSNKLQNHVTHFINRKRNRIASGNEKLRGGQPLPKPEIMMLVEWDRELAFLAQRLADQCEFVHDDCRATVRYPFAGQSVGEVRWRRSSDTDDLIAQRAVRRVLEAWWGEKRRVVPKQLITPFRLGSRGAVWGHFTQLAVWTLRAVGCGAVRHGSVHPRFLLVCDFSHTNMLGQKTITPGPLAPCPVHTARKSRSTYPLLCGPVRRFKYEDIQDTEYEEDYVDSDEQPDFQPPEEWARNSDRKTEKQNKDRNLSRISSQNRPTSKQFDQDAAGYPVVEMKKANYKLNQQTLSYDDQTMEARTLHTSIRKIYKTTLSHHPTYADYYRPTDRVDLTTRQHWKQTRDRPIRPGANALLNYQSIEVPRYTRLSSVASLMLDKDGADQLFKDTGFSVPWKKVQG